MSEGSAFVSQSSPAAAPVKSKTTSVVLAVLFGPFAWLYTYRTDAWKFWVGLGLNVVLGTLLWLVLFGWVVYIAVAIWVIVDVSIRPSEFYSNFPNFKK